METIKPQIITGVRDHCGERSALLGLFVLAVLHHVMLFHAITH